jgi:hypothetical protein
LTQHSRLSTQDFSSEHSAFLRLAGLTDHRPPVREVEAVIE